MRTSPPERYKCLLVIQDGIGDRPIESLGRKTPLEAAFTPHMDALIARGIAGLIDIVAPGVKVGTDIGHLALFGQDITNDSYGRGPMEAAGVGIVLKPGDVALRCNFATVDENFRILDRRAGRIRAETETLTESLNQIRLDERVEILFRPATEHRAVLVLRGEGLSDQISDSDPGSGNADTFQEVRALVDHPHAKRAARILNQIVRASYEILKDHSVNQSRRNEGKPPANMILTRGAGMRQDYINLPAKLRLKAACISGECTVLGIARLSGVTPIATEEMTANLDTNLSEKARKAVEALHEYELVYLHLKGCDVAGHDRRPELKKSFIERTDSMMGEIRKETEEWKHLYFAFAGDHSTPCSLGEHSGDPVPVFLTGEGVLTDDVKTYGERACARGGLGRIRCKDFLSVIFDYLRT